jgi:hypothetical protein
MEERTVSDYCCPCHESTRAAAERMWCASCLRIENARLKARLAEVEGERCVEMVGNISREGGVMPCGAPLPCPDHPTEESEEDDG